MRRHPWGARAVAAILLASMLGSCALVAPQTAQLPVLAGVPAAFSMSGRLALRAGERSEIVRLRWTHRPAADLWAFASPLGNEVARIESGPEGAVLVHGDERLEAESFAALSERFLGVPLEPAMLARWLHGSVPPAVASGWEVTLEETQAAGSVAIARRLRARRGETTVRLVVDEYRAIAE